MKNVSVKKMDGKGKNVFRAVLIVAVLIFATCFALAACATGEDVQIEKVTSASEINRLIAKANFSAENAVRDKMEGRYGALSDYSYNNGRATADIVKDGKSYSVTVEIEVDESDFSVTRYKNATRSGDRLIYTQNGEEVTYSVADKIVVEENGSFYVIDVSGANAEIDRAVSAAILTEKGGSQEENPDSQIETIDDINVIEQLLSQKDLTIEALAKAAAIAFYGQDNVSNLSYQNGIVSGQAKTAEGTVNFSANLDLSATDFEGKSYAGAELSADGKTLSFYQNGTLATLTITEDMAVIETADGVNLLDTAVAEQMVANKFETTNHETSVPSQDITFDSWQELMSAGNGVVQDAVFDILQTNLFTESVIKNMFGNDMTTANLNDGTIEILKWVFDTNDSNEITAIEVMGTRTGFPANATRVRIETASFTLQTPIALDSIGAGASNNDNTISYPDGEGEVTIDLSAIATGTINASFNTGFRHTVTDQNLNDTMKSYFDLCMPLAVEAGLINADATLGFVSVQGSSSTNSKWGTTFNIVIRFVDLNTNKYYYLNFMFDDNRASNTSIIEAINDAIESGQFGSDMIQPSQIISGDQIFEFSEAMEGIVKYTIPDKNQK